MYLLWQHLGSGEVADGTLPADEFAVGRPAMGFRLRDSGLVSPASVQVR